MAGYVVTKEIKTVAETLLSAGFNDFVSHKVAYVLNVRPWTFQTEILESLSLEEEMAKAFPNFKTECGSNGSTLSVEFGEHKFSDKPTQMTYPFNCM